MVILLSTRTYINDALLNTEYLCIKYSIFEFRHILFFFRQQGNIIMLEKLFVPFAKKSKQQIRNNNIK